MQKDTTHMLQVMHWSQWDYGNGSLVDDIHTFDGKPDLYFDSILKLDNMAVVTKQNLKELTLGKAQGAIIKCLKSLPADVSWSNGNAILRQLFWKNWLRLSQNMSPKICIYVQKLFNPAVSFNTIQHVHLPLPKSIYYAWKVEKNSYL